MKKLRKYGRKIKEILQDDHTTAYYYSDEKIERPKPEHSKVGTSFWKAMRIKTQAGMKN